MSKKWINYTLAAILSLLTSSSAFAYAFSLNLTFDSSYTTAQRTIFNNAAGYWESVITGYQPGYNGVDGISIDVGIRPTDGPYNIVGSAGWDTAIFEGGTRYYTETGSMQYDTADISRLEDNNTLYDVAVHEIAHILGFGTLWEHNNLYNGDGGYDGSAALAAYQAEFGNPSAAFIPVELGGGGGTAHGHWDEVGPTDQDSNNSANPMPSGELMTGWINPPHFVSNTTLASFIDLGYTVNLTAVPLPAAVWLFGSGLLGLIGWSKRKQAA
jgi:hypothetical protein